MTAHLQGLVADCDNTLWGWNADHFGILEFLRRTRRIAPSRAYFCTNWCRPMEAAMLAPFGELCTAGTNCDDLVSDKIAELIERDGVQGLTLLGGDHIYAETIIRLRRRFRFNLLVVSLKSELSRELLRVADTVMFADMFGARSRPDQSPDSHLTAGDRPLFLWASGSTRLASAKIGQVSRRA